MDSYAFPPPHLQAILDRFVAACRADERVAAALLVGSYARGAADAHSDLDLFLITDDDAYDAFVAARHDFVRALGEPLFREDFDIPDIVFLIFPEGAEVEIHFAPAARLGAILDEPHWSLLDKRGLLAAAAAPYAVAGAPQSTEALRRQIAWFWHDLSHFTTAVARGQLWWAAGQLEVLRRITVNLARLRHNLNDPDVGSDPWFKIDTALPGEDLTPLRETFAPLERKAMLAAARVLVAFYRQLAAPLAETHGLAYPAELDRLMTARLEALDAAP